MSFIDFLMILGGFWWILLIPIVFWIWSYPKFSTRLTASRTKYVKWKFFSSDCLVWDKSGCRHRISGNVWIYAWMQKCWHMRTHVDTMRTHAETFGKIFPQIFPKCSPFLWLQRRSRHIARFFFPFKHLTRKRLFASHSPIAVQQTEKQIHFSDFTPCWDVKHRRLFFLRRRTNFSRGKFNFHSESRNGNLPARKQKFCRVTLG